MNKDKPSTKKRSAIKLIAGVIILAVLIYVFRYSPLKDFLSLDAIQTFLTSLGPWGPVIYILMYVVLTVVFFPASLLTIAGGFAFGIFLGTLYAIVGATIAAVLAFYIGRYFAKDWVEQSFGKTFQKYNKKLSERGFQTVAIMRLLFLPYIPLSYAAGASRVSIGAFVLATFLTNFPGGFAFAYLGNSITDPRTILIAVVFIGLVLLIPRITKKFVKNH